LQITYYNISLRNSLQTLQTVVTDAMRTKVGHKPLSSADNFRHKKSKMVFLAKKEVSIDVSREIYVGTYAHMFTHRNDAYVLEFL
jgi:hypothetical protein